MATRDDLKDLLPDLEGVEEQYARELIERAHQVAQLTQHPGWGFYQDYLIALTTSAQTKLIDGNVKDMEEYRKLVGRIDGIRAALQAPNMLEQQVRNMREQAVEDSEDVDSWP